MGSAPGPGDLTNPNSESTEGSSSAELPFALFFLLIQCINPFPLIEDQVMQL